MSNILYRKYRLYDDTIRRLLQFTGLWPSHNPRLLHRLFCFSHSSAVFLMICFLFNFCRYHFGNLDLCLKSLSLALSFLTMLQKTICLTFYRNRLVKLHESLATSFSQDLDNVELRPILLSPLISFYRSSMILSVVTYATIALYWIRPVITIAIQLWRGVNAVKYALPFPTLYPWKIHANSYMVHYVFEIYAGICIGAYTSLIDSLFGYYIFQISGQLRTLSHRVRNISSSDNYRKVIRECAVRHQILTKCQNHLERIYGPIVLWMLVTNAIVMCGLIYQASHMSSGKAALVVFYIMMKCGQTLFYGWFGSFLTTENDMFRHAIYGSNWAGSGEKCLMTDILIMMTYKPFVLKACNLSTISVDMFIAVSNTAVSYFFMIRTLEGGKNL